MIVILQRLDTVITISEGNKVTVGNKSKNLVKNGYLENKNNDNFPKFSYNQDGYLYVVGNSNSFPRYLTYMSTEYIPVDTSKKYRESFTFKTNNVNANNYLGIIEYDIDYNTILSQNFMYVKNTLTY